MYLYSYTLGYSTLVLHTLRVDRIRRASEIASTIDLNIGLKERVQLPSVCGCYLHDAVLLLRWYNIDEGKSRLYLIW